MTSDTTSAGMPAIVSTPDALDVVVSPFAKATTGVKSFVGDSKAQLASTLNGLSETVRDIAMKLDGNGAAPLAGYVHSAADSVAGWAMSVEHKSVDELVDDARSLVRANPALAVGLAVTTGFVVARIARSGR